MLSIDMSLNIFRRENIRLIPHFGKITEQKGNAPSLPQQTTSHPPKRYPLMAAFTMTDNQQVIVTISATDKRGNPTPVPTGTVVAASDNTTVLTATVNSDGTVTFTAAGTLGTANGSVTVNDTNGNALASGTIAFTITSDAPSQLVLTPGTPTEQP